MRSPRPCLKASAKLLDIAMAIAGTPRIVLLDEPTSDISIEEKFDLMAIVMSALKGRNITVLFVEHDMDIVERYADRVLAFYDGTVIADGPRIETLENPRIQELISGPKLNVAALAAVMLRVDRPQRFDRCRRHYPRRVARARCRRDVRAYWPQRRG